jgi:hypothetical protein
MIMTEHSFNTLRVDDARITKVVLDGTTLFLSLRDWQETIMALVFSQVIGVEEFGIFNVDLGEAIETTTDPILSLKRRAIFSMNRPVAFNATA